MQQVGVNMQTRSLGSSNIQIVPLVLGGNVFGWTIDASTSFRVLDAFVDRGFNCIDTADVYSRWLPGNHGNKSELRSTRHLKCCNQQFQVRLHLRVQIQKEKPGAFTRPHRPARG